MIETIGTMLEKAGDMAELRAMLSAAYGEIDSSALAAALAGGIAAAHAAGRADLAEEAE